MQVRFCDETDDGFSWIAATPRALERTAHALVRSGVVWIVDPIEGAHVDERIAALGKPVGVVQLLARHRRDCAAFAARFGVPLHVLPAELPGTPFETIVLYRSVFREVSLWWPETRTLVVAEALGTARFYRAPGERLGVHPLLRLTPPRRLGRVVPERLMLGHGEGIREGADEALREALDTARRRLPAVMGGLAGQLRPRR